MVKFPDKSFCIIRRDATFSRGAVLIFPNKEEAIKLYDQILHIIKQEKVLRVSDLYWLIDISPIEDEYHKGWTFIDGAFIRKAGREYKLVLPKLDFKDS